MSSTILSFFEMFIEIVSSMFDKLRSESTVSILTEFEKNQQLMGVLTRLNNLHYYLEY